MTIEELRKLGYSYKSISEKMGISINTVKSYCRRNHLEKGTAENNSNICMYCRKPIANTEHKRKKKFCSDSCRMKWWNAHRLLIMGKSKTKIKCNYCGKEFETYPKDKRKYCSHECYIKERFG